MQMSDTYSNGFRRCLKFEVVNGHIQYVCQGAHIDYKLVLV